MRCGRSGFRSQHGGQERGEHGRAYEGANEHGRVQRARNLRNLPRMPEEGVSRGLRGDAGDLEGSGVSGLWGMVAGRPVLPARGPWAGLGEGESMTGDIPFSDPLAQVTIEPAPYGPVTSYQLTFGPHTLTVSRCPESGWLELALDREAQEQGLYFTLPIELAEALSRLDLAGIVRG